MARRRDENNRAMYIISVAAELAGVHPQTLRVYERKGLLTPQRTEGNTRRYSPRDIELLQRIQELTTEGINLAGVMKILDLEIEIAKLRAREERALKTIAEMENQLAEALDARDHTALVRFRDVRRIRRAMKSDDIDQATRPRVFEAPPAG